METMTKKIRPFLLTSLLAICLVPIIGCSGNSNDLPDIQATVDAAVAKAMKEQNKVAPTPTDAADPVIPVEDPTPTAAANLTATPTSSGKAPTPTATAPYIVATPTDAPTPTATIPGPAKAKRSRDRMFIWPGETTGVYECTEDTARAFTNPIVAPELLTDIEPMGKMASSHVTPTDHLYVHWKRPVEGTTNYVTAPADGEIVEIGRFPQDKAVRYDRSITVPDYRMVLMHSCAFFTIFIHLAELAPEIKKQTGPIGLGEQWFSTRNGPISVKAGDPLAEVSGTGLDWSVHDADVILPGFIIPEHYIGEPWKIHSVDPFQYYEEPLKSELLSKAVRQVEPRSGKIDYDVEGTILGNWFLEGTNDYDGSPDFPKYYSGHLSIAYGWIDPTQVRISIGFETGIDDDNLCNVCFGAYAVRGNSPDPAGIGTENGLVKYELMSRRGPNHEQVGYTALGTFLVQHLGNRTLRVEFLLGKSPDNVSGFSSNALTYYR